MDRDVHIGDRWLLCSDGVTDYLPEDDVERALEAAASPATAAASLVALALEAGSAGQRDSGRVRREYVRPIASAGQAPTFYGAAADRFCEELETPSAQPATGARTTMT